jgi:hypothetical protein
MSHQFEVIGFDRKKQAFGETAPELFNRAVWKTRFPSGALEKLGEVTGNYWDFDEAKPYQIIKSVSFVVTARAFRDVGERSANSGYVSLLDYSSRNTFFSEKLYLSR